MWRRRAGATPARDSGCLDVRDREALGAALARVASDTTTVTVYMCWHDGTGHGGYPADVLQAAGRLRDRHTGDSGSDDQYTSLTFMPLADDLADFVAVAPYCDLAYAADAHGDVLLEVSGEGASGSLRSSRDTERPGL